MTAPTGTPRDIALAVREAILAVYRDTGRSLRETPASALLGKDLGLDSLDLAQVIVLLERALGVDPFRDPQAGTSLPRLRTVDDLIGLYSAAVAERP